MTLFKTIIFQFFRMASFSLYIASVYLRRLFSIRVPLDKETLSRMNRLFITKENCTIDIAKYNRDFYMFRSLTTKTFGNKIVGIVGMLHLKNISKLLARYQEAYEKLYESNQDENTLLSAEKVEEINAKYDEMIRNMIDYCNFKKGDLVCACQKNLSVDNK